MESGTSGLWWGRSGRDLRRGRRPGRWRAGRCRRRRASGGLAGGWDVVARIGVEAGCLARGGLVGAGDAGRLAGLAGGGDEVARIGVEAGEAQARSGL